MLTPADIEQIVERRVMAALAAKEEQGRAAAAAFRGEARDVPMTEGARPSTAPAPQPLDVPLPAPQPAARAAAAPTPPLSMQSPAARPPAAEAGGRWSASSAPWHPTSQPMPSSVPRGPETYYIGESAPQTPPYVTTSNRGPAVAPSTRSRRPCPRCARPADGCTCGLSSQGPVRDWQAPAAPPQAPPPPPREALPPPGMPPGRGGCTHRAAVRYGNNWGRGWKCPHCQAKWFTRWDGRTTFTSP